jgi:serine/threonine protein kinase
VDLPPAVLSGERTAGGGTASILDRQVDGRRAAIRLLHIEDHAARERFVREVQLLRELNEEAVGKEVGLYIPALRQAGFLKADSNQGVVVYDWVDGKSLFQACLSPFSIARIGLALARVLAFFGKNDVVHRDIKPANIIASPPTDPTESEDVRPVLIDFGLARHILPGRFTNIPGTEGFIPPEVCHGADWMPAGDVFSLGRTLQCMLPAGDRGLETPRLMCLIRQMAHTEPSQRPVGSRLVKEFEGIIDEEVKHKRMKWVRETLGEIPTCCAPIAAQIDSFAVSVRDGLVPLPDWMIWLSYLLESAVGGLIRERSQLKNALETKKGENKWSTYLLQGDLIADIDQTFACLRKRSAKTAGHLRNAHGHPIDRDSKIREVARFLRVDQLPDRTKYEHIMCSIGEACQCVDTLIGITPGLFSKLYELARQAAGARH